MPAPAPIPDVLLCERMHWTWFDLYEMPQDAIILWGWALGLIDQARAKVRAASRDSSQGYHVVTFDETE